MPLNLNYTVQKLQTTKDTTSLKFNSASITYEYRDTMCKLNIGYQPISQTFCEDIITKVGLLCSCR